MSRIHRIDIPQPVRVRKYEIDCEVLSNLLRKHKALTGKSNKELAEALNEPLTKVEHWFRTDSCFAIPSEDVWFYLKEQLGITTTEFDEAITTFEERPGVYEKSDRCYFTDGIAPTLTSASAGNEKIIYVREATEDSKTRRGRADKQMAQTLTTSPQQGVVVEEPMVIGGVGEKKSNGGKQWYLQDRIYADGVAVSVATGFNPYYATSTTPGTELRIRKLTPKECFRLMGFDDTDFDKASSVNSNTQLYKQAGNSIGVPVLEHIMAALFDCGALVR